MSGKKLFQYDRQPVTIYATFKFDGNYGKEIAIIRDCGADDCTFRIVLVDKNKISKVTDEFGNGNDRPNISYDGKTLVLEFGVGRNESKRTVVRFNEENLTTLKH